MRASLVVSGGIIALTGVVLFVTLAGDAWLALTAGGVVVLVSGFILQDIEDRVEPPPGYRFCPFCSTPVLIGSERCDHCNGLQPEVAASPEASSSSPPQPNH
ncbi:MAG: hypothetical protein OK455_05895 [Thaumarchaeota archaeon]|nr:hypothetical protein [Nitrososphaerota archaeon]